MLSAEFIANPIAYRSWRLQIGPPGLVAAVGRTVRSARASCPFGLPHQWHRRGNGPLQASRRSRPACAPPPNGRARFSPPAISAAQVRTMSMPAAPGLPCARNPRLQNSLGDRQSKSDAGPFAASPRLVDWPRNTALRHRNVVPCRPQRNQKWSAVSAVTATPLRVIWSRCAESE